jgi:hypothetical protein
MKRAVLGSLVFFSLYTSTVLRADEDVFTAGAVTTALDGFGEAFFRSSCFYNRRDPRPLQIAVAEMEASTKFTDHEEQIISDFIEEKLATDHWFQVIPRRLRSELDEIRKALGESKSLPTSDQLDGIIAIRPTAIGGQKQTTMRTINVIAYAYADDRLCVGLTRSIAIGKIVEAPDVPGRFFERAARKLPDKNIERVVVMPPDIAGFGNIIPARILGQRLREQLADAIKKVFQTRSQLSPRDSGRPPVLADVGGLDASQAWKAILHLNRSSQGGIEVRVEFLSPGNQSGSLVDNGYFASDEMSTDAAPEAVSLSGGPSIAREKETHVDEAAKLWSGGVRDSKSVTVLLDFVGRYSDTTYGALAKERIEALKAPPKAEIANPDLINNSLWNHNGSTMLLRLSGSEIKFYYNQPRPGMAAEGVKSGMLLFSGHRSLDQVSGISHIFNRRCDEGFPYQVSGDIRNDARQITLRGILPQINFSLCIDTHTGSRLDKLVFERID